MFCAIHPTAAIRIRLRDALVAAARALETLAALVRSFAEDAVWPGT